MTGREPGVEMSDADDVDERVDVVWPAAGGVDGTALALGDAGTAAAAPAGTPDVRVDMVRRRGGGCGTGSAPGLADAAAATSLWRRISGGAALGGGTSVRGPGVLAGKDRRALPVRYGSAWNERRTATT